MLATLHTLIYTIIADHFYWLESTMSTQRIPKDSSPESTNQRCFYLLTLKECPTMTQADMLSLPEFIRVITPPQVWVGSTGYVLSAQIFMLIRIQWGLLTF